MDSVEDAKGEAFPWVYRYYTVLNVCACVILGTSPTVFGHMGNWCCM